jgi:hypothetical protein
MMMRRRTMKSSATVQIATELGYLDYRGYRRRRRQRQRRRVLAFVGCEIIIILMFIMLGIIVMNSNINEFSL